MEKKLSLADVLCLLSLFSILTFVSPIATAEAKTLKVGLITSVTGMMAPAFKPMFDAAKPAEEMINKMGGITVKGEKYNIEVLVEDDQSSPPGAIAAANKLLQQGVKYLIPPMFMPSNMAIASITEEAKVLRMKALGSGPEEVNPDNPYSFFTCSSLYMIAPVYEFLQKNYPNAKRIAIIRHEDPGMKVPHEFNAKEIKKRGLELVFEETFKLGTEDYYPVLTKAFQKKPDVISLVISIVPWTAGIVNQARELGFKGPIICGAPFGDVNLVNGIINDEYAYDIFSSAPDVMSDKMTPMVKEHKTLVAKVSKNPYTLDSILPLDALYILKQCIEAAQSIDTEVVKNTIETKMNKIDTVWGPGEWGGEEIFGVKHVVRAPIPFSRIMDSKVEFQFIPYK